MKGAGDYNDISVKMDMGRNPQMFTPTIHIIINNLFLGLCLCLWNLLHFALAIVHKFALVDVLLGG